MTRSWDLSLCWDSGATNPGIGPCPAVLLPASALILCRHPQEGISVCSQCQEPRYGHRREKETPPRDSFGLI